MDRQIRATLQQYQVFTFSYVGRQGTMISCQHSEHPAAAPGVWECRTYGLGARGLRITAKRLWCTDCVRAVIERGCSSRDAADNFMLHGRMKQATLVRAYNESTNACLTGILPPGSTEGYLVTTWLLSTLASEPVEQRPPQQITYSATEIDRARLAVLLMYEVDKAEVLSEDDKTSFNEVFCSWARARGIINNATLTYIQDEIHRQNGEQQHE